MSSDNQEFDKAAAFSTQRKFIIEVFDSISQGDVERLRRILSPEEVNEIAEGQGRRPIHAAAMAGKLNSLQFLLSIGADINSTDDDGETVALIAMRHKRLNIIEFLVENHKDVLFMTNKSKMSVFHIAAEAGYVNIVKNLLQLGFDVNQESNNGTALELAVVWKQTEMIEFLLENGADANGSRGKYLPPALCISVSMQYEEAVELLLKFGADANVADSDGFTPLANCAEFNFSSMAQKIIQSGGQINSKVFLSALKNNNHAFIDTILPKAAEVEISQEEVKDQEQAEQCKLAGNQYFQQELYEEAIQQYSLALENNPQNSIYYSNRAQAFLKIQDYEKALQDAQISRTYDPSNSKAWFREGMALQAQEKYREAVIAYWNGMKLDNTNKELKTKFLQCISKY